MREARLPNKHKNARTKMCALITHKAPSDDEMFNDFNWQQTKKKRKNDARRESKGEKNVIERDWQ